LRERKKRQTRLAIQDAALRLFTEHGYRETTIEAIAGKADVAPRTVTVHFPTKEELLFDAEPFTLETLAETLEARAPHESALDALRGWMASTMASREFENLEMDGRFWERRALRVRIIDAEPELRGRARAGYFAFEQVLAAAIGKDLGQPATALVPRLAALTVATGLRELYEADEARGLASPPKAADLLALVDRVIDFARAGIECSPASSSDRRKRDSRRLVA
jgi:AcrR family transcriptional regulator